MEGAREIKISRDLISDLALIADDQIMMSDT
jgi:hypothetical protein